MKKITLLAILALSLNGFGQFTTGVVALTGSARTIKIDTNATTATMTLTGLSTHWLGIGFNGFSMFEVTDMFIWNATTNRDYTPSGGHSIPSADAAASQSWTIVSDNVSGTTRTVVATRPLVSAGDYTFLNNNSAINIIFSEGSTTTLAYHGNNPHDTQTLQRTALGIEDFSLNAASVFPNPANGSFTITTKSALETVTIYSQTGALIKTIEVKNAKEKAEVLVNDLSTGVYLIELKSSTDKSWKKVIVK